MRGIKGPAGVIPNTRVSIISRTSTVLASPLRNRSVAPERRRGRRRICYLSPTAHIRYHHPSSNNLNILPLSPFQRLRSITQTKHISSTAATMSSASSFYDFTPVDKKGEPFPLGELKGKVVLVVNTASKCGFTPQFDGLEKLYKEVSTAHPNKFTIIGFPCNQFGSQDPGSNDEIQEFCKVNYGVTFPVLGKVDVNGDKAAPVYEWMKKQKPGIMGLKLIKWNFEKFLIGPDGLVKARWASTTAPATLKAAIEKELASVEKPAA